MSSSAPKHPRRRARARIFTMTALAAALLSATCTSGDAPLSPTLPSSATRLSVRPQYLVLGGAYQSDPINRIHLTARAIPSQQVFADTVIDVSPNAASWDLGIDLRLPDNQTEASVVVTLELINHTSSGDAVQWSGMTDPVSVKVGTVAPPPPTVNVFPGPPANLSVTSIVTSPDSVSLTEGDSTHFNATVAGASGTPLVVWSTLDPTVATVSLNGTVRGLRNGVARVVAQAGPKADTALVRFSQRITGVNVIQDSASLVSIGEEVLLSVRAVDGRGDSIAGSGFSFTIRDGTIIEQSGAARFRARANGRTVVVATSTVQPALRDSVIITVSQRIASATIAPISATVTSLGAATQMTASARDALGNAVASTPAWSTDNAAVMTVDATGLARSVSNGIAHITATFPGGIAAAATLTVAQQPAAITVAPPATAFTSINDTIRLTATARDANGSAIPAVAFTWSTSDAAVAVVDANGLVRAVSGGTATFTARSGTITGTAQVTLTQRATRVTISPRAASASSIGETFPFTLVATDARNSAIAAPAITWRSGSTAVAAIGATGIATTTGNGNTFIVAEVDGVRDSVPLTVRQVAARITLQSAPDSVAVGDTLRVRATAFDARNNPITAPVFAWTSSAPGKASVNATGLVTGVSNGPADITASVDGQNAVAHITVYVPGPASIEVTPAELAFDALTQVSNLTAVVRNGRNQILPNSVISWTSTQPSVATVDINGTVQATGQGSALIIARAGSVADTVSVTVQQEAQRVVLSPDSAVITTLGGAVNFTAVVRDRLNSPITPATVTFTSLTPTIVSVDGAGHVVALANGVGRVRAAFGAIADTANVRVNAGQANLIATSLSFVPVDTFRVGGSYPMRAVIRNIGPVTSAATALNLSANAVGALPPPLLSVTFPIGAINPGDSAVVLGNVPLDSLVQWPDSVVGVLTIDPANLVPESNEADNIVARVYRLVTPVATVRSDSTAIVTAGDSVQITAHAYDRYAREVLNRLKTWTSLDPTIATVGATGRVRGVSPGVARIRVTIEGVSDTTLVTVNAVPSGSRIWNGLVSNAWNVAGNWSPANVPTSADSVVIAAGATRSLVLTGNVSAGSVVIEAGATVSMNEYTLTAHGHASVNGTLIDGTLEMAGAGKTLRATVALPTVSIADSTIVGNSMTIDGGLIVNGKLVIGNREIAVNGSSGLVQYSRGLVMSNPGGWVIIAHNALFLGGTPGLMTAGRLSINGNFTASAAPDAFEASGSHKTIFSGASAQTISFGAPGIAAQHFNELWIDHAAATQFLTRVFVTDSVTLNGEVGPVTAPGVLVTIGGSLVDNGPSAPWQVDSTKMTYNFPRLPTIMSTNLIFQTADGGYAELQNDFNLTGSLTVEGGTGQGLELNGHSVNVSGNVQIFSQSSLIVGSGALEADGDLQATGGSLDMQDGDGTVTVHGNANFIFGVTTNRLTAGTLDVARNFSVGGVGDAFAPSGTHTTVLSGDTTQTVSFTTPGPLQHFHNLQISNGIAVVFATDFTVNGATSIYEGAGPVSGNTGVTPTLNGAFSDPSHHWMFGPNLTITDMHVTPSDNLHVFNTYPIHLSIKNTGTAETIATWGVLRVYSAATGPVGEPIFQLTAPIPPLAAGATMSIDTTLYVAPGTPDSIIVQMRLDVPPVNSEITIDDNVATTSVIHILPPEAPAANADAIASIAGAAPVQALRPSLFHSAAPARRSPARE